MTRYLVFVICVLGAALAPLAAVAQNTSSHTITILPAPYDWQQIVGHFDALADAIGTTSVEGATTEPFDPAALHDFRIVCAEPLVAWARELILADCTDLADCVSRKASMERIARELAEEVSVRLDDDAPDASVFLRPGMELKSSLSDRAEALSLRSAHDQWLSAWSIPKKLMANENAVARDEARIMDRVWCDMVRENAKAAISHVEEFGFPSDVPDSGQGHLVTALVNIAIHVAWSPQLTGPLRAASDEAFDQGRLSGYHAAYMVDIDTMANLSAQRIGFLWACDGASAYPSPPLIDHHEAAELRRQYGLPALEATQASRSRQCMS